MEIPTTPATPQTEQPQLTRGQQVMSVPFFYFDQREDVTALKQIFADCYDAIDKWTQEAHTRNVSKPYLDRIQIGSDISRLAAIAKTNLETAQMYAIKAITR